MGTVNYRLGKLSFLILLLILLVTIPIALKLRMDQSSSPTAHNRESGFVGSSNCGPLSLQVVCRLFGIDASDNELAAFAGTDGSGTTINGLCRAARQKGLNATVVQWSIEELKEWKLPVIAFVDGNHFLVVESFEEEQFHIWDPPRPPTHISEHALMQRWKGHAVIFQLVFKETGPRIALNRALYHFGEISENQTVQYSFKLYNVGDANLEITRIKSSCRCTSSTLKSQTIPPGGIEYVEVDYDSRGFSGKVEEKITITSNDPVRPVATLTISGYVRSIPKALPSVLFARLSDIEQTKQISIQSPPSERPVAILSATSNTLGIVPTVVKTGNQSVVSVKIRTDEINTTRDARVIIYTNSPDAPEISVPIKLQEKVPIKFVPKQIFFGTVGGSLETREQQQIREVHFFVDDTSQFEIQHIQKQSPHLSIEFTSDESNDSIILRVKLNHTAFAGTLRDTILLHANFRGEHAQVSIPVYAMVID